MLRYVGSLLLLAAVAVGKPSWKDAYGNLTESISYHGFRNFSQDADLNNNGFIDNTELVQALFAAGDTNSDSIVSQAEFLDYMRQRLPHIPSPVLAIMFDLLDNLNDDLGVPTNYTPSCQPQLNVFSNLNDLGDGVLRSADVSLLNFVGSSSASISVAQFEEALETWKSEAWSRVHKHLKKPFKISKPYENDFSFDLLIVDLDMTKDGILTAGEAGAQLAVITPGGRVTREDWINRGSERYGDHPVVSAIKFDYLDINDDLVVSAEDFKTILMRADVNHDERTTKQEFYQYMQKLDKRTRHALGLPVKVFSYDCPQPQWNDDDDCDDEFAIDVFMMDVDTNFDGEITPWELRRYIHIMDHNDDYKVDRVEYIKFAKARYGIDYSVSDLEFDAMDINGDGVFDWSDQEKTYPDMKPMCLCEFRVATLASMRAAKHLAKERQMKAHFLRMKYFWLMTKGLHSATFMDPKHDPSSQWIWMTMNGRPPMKDCHKCGAKQPWGPGEGEAGKERDDDDDDFEKEDDWKMVYMIIHAMKKMQMTAQWSAGDDGEWKMMKVLVHAMKIIKMELSADDHYAGNVTDMAKWMAWKMATMKVEKVNDKMTVTWKAAAMAKGSVMKKVGWRHRIIEGDSEEKKPESGWSNWNGWQSKEKKPESGWSNWMGWQPEENKPKPGWSEWTGWHPEENKPKPGWSEWTGWQPEENKPKPGWSEWNGWHPEEKKPESSWSNWMGWHKKDEKEEYGASMMMKWFAQMHKQKEESSGGMMEKLMEWFSQYQKKEKESKPEWSGWGSWGSK